MARFGLPVLYSLLDGVVDGKRTVRLLGIAVSGLVPLEELRHERQVARPSLWDGW